MLRLLLVRHGQTAWNVQRRVLGATDVPLDDTGLEQAETLAAHLAPPDALWSSPLARARQTAEALAQRGSPPVTVRVDPRLAEMNQGDLEGLGEMELSARFGDLLHAWRADPGGLRLPGGETMNETVERAIAALLHIARDESAREGAAGELRHVAVVTHQVVIEASVCGLLGEPLSRWQRHTLRNTAWTELEWDGARLTVVAERQAPHLPAG